MTTGASASISIIILEIGVYVEGVIFNGGVQLALNGAFNKNFYGELKAIMIIEAGTI